MNQEWREIGAGFAVLIVFAAVLAFSYGGQRIQAPSGYAVQASFNRVDGLIEGDQVQLGGINVGRVERMDINQDFRAVVTLRMAPDVELPADTAAAIHTDGLFGSKYVVLEPGGDERLLQDGASITFTQDSVVVGELLDLIISEGKANRAKAQEDTGMTGGSN